MFYVLAGNQLLGDAPSGSHGHTSAKSKDIPLRAWIKDHQRDEAVVLGVS